jgi:hypothetical protein
VSEDNGSSAFSAVGSRESGARRRTESVWQFLERSSEQVAATARAQWDSWLIRMPPEPRKDLIRRLKDRSDEQVRAAFAELITFVLLDSVYPAVEIDPVTGSCSRTDFAVDVPVHTHFEVHRPSPSKDVAMDARRQGAIADALEKVNSPDFWLDVQVHSGTNVPSMRKVRQEAEGWLASLDYNAEVHRREEYQRDRRQRAAEEMLCRDASPAERAAYFAALRPFEPPGFERSGPGWSVRITAHPRSADQRGEGQFTIGVRSAGKAHLATFEDLQGAIRQKIKQHAGLADPLVVVLDLSSPIIEDHDIASMLYGRTTTTMAGPATPLATTRKRHEGIWPDPVLRPPRPAAVLVLRGIWLGSAGATAELWLPPGEASPLLLGPRSARTLGADGLTVEIHPSPAVEDTDASSPEEIGWLPT